MRVLVTGATGHLGCNLVRSLLAHGYKVRAMIHTNRMGLDDLPVEQVNGDVRDVDSLVKAMQDIDIVFNCAGYISILRTEGKQLDQVNVAGVRNVVAACQRAGIKRLAHFSSIHSLMQEPFGETLDETRTLVSSLHRPPYDLSKAAGERIVRAAVNEGLDAVIINPTAIIGPYDYRPSHVGQVLIDLCQRHLPALVNAGFDWVDVRDVAEGSVRVAEKAPAGGIYLLSGHWHPFAYLAQLVQETTGVKLPKLTLPLWVANVGAPFTTAWAKLRHERAVMTSVSLEALRSNRHISHERATALFGYSPRPLKDTVYDTLHWFAAQGMIQPF
ncbi:MAG: NAD-dependent epimerase/dehydratase family protein [Anaerolineae bacterium]